MRLCSAGFSVLLAACSTNLSPPTVDRADSGVEQLPNPAPAPTREGARAAPRATLQLSLSLADHGPATVMVPSVLDSSMPVIVALHAHAIRPEHACQRWFTAARKQHLVLCPHGLPRDAKATQSVTLGEASYTKREIDRGLEAMRIRFGESMSEAPPFLVGWSHGAKIAIELLVRYPMEFSHVALGEGGYANLDEKALAALKKHDHRRLLLLCTSSACTTTYGATVRRFRGASLNCLLESHPGNEHPFDNAAVDLAERTLPWLFEDSSPRVLTPQT